MNELERFEDWVHTLGSDAELVELPFAATSVEAVARATGTEPSRLVKSLVVQLDGRAGLAFVFGAARLDLEKLRICSGALEARMAPRKEIHNLAGFDAGDVPPWRGTWSTHAWLDQAHPASGWVVGGGGRPNRLLRIQAERLYATLDAQVVSIS